MQYTFNCVTTYSLTRDKYSNENINNHLFKIAKQRQQSTINPVLNVNFN